MRVLDIVAKGARLAPNIQAHLCVVLEFVARWTQQHFIMSCRWILHPLAHNFTLKWIRSKSTRSVFAFRANGAVKTLLLVVVRIYHQIRPVRASAVARIGLAGFASRISARGTRHAVGKGLRVRVGIVGVLRTGATGLRPRHVLVFACCAWRTGLAHLQHALCPLGARPALLLLPLVCHADLRVAHRTRLQLIHPVLCQPSRVLHHRHHHIIAPADQPRRALLARVLVGVYDVLGLQTRVALGAKLFIANAKGTSV